MLLAPWHDTSSSDSSVQNHYKHLFFCIYIIIMYAYIMASGHILNRDITFLVFVKINLSTLSDCLNELQKAKLWKKWLPVAAPKIYTEDKILIKFNQ